MDHQGALSGGSRVPLNMNRAATLQLLIIKKALMNITVRITIQLRVVSLLLLLLFSSYVQMNNDEHDSSTQIMM